MFDLSKIESQRKTKPPRIVIYGAPKIGKTTFAAQSENPVLIDLEGGSDNLDVARVGRDVIRSLDDIISFLRALYQRDHDYKTIVIDSIDWLERMVFEEVARENKASSIDDFSAPSLRFGRGYTMAQDKIKELLAALDSLRARKNMTVIFVCHSVIEKFEDPEQESFDHHTLKLNKKIKSLVQEWSDCILFARQKIYVTTNTGGFGRETKKGRSGERVLCTQGTASYLAGNRYQLPEELPLDFKAFWHAFVTQTGFNQAAMTPAPKTAKVVPITTTTTPNSGAAQAVYQNAEYLEL
jgi:hypothetical protein